MWSGSWSCLAHAAAPVLAEDWSRFRGPNGAGVSPSRGLPVEFSSSKNVDWAVDVPFGRPLLSAFAGDRIFVTATEGGKLVTLALDRASGKVLWKQALERRETATLYHDNDSATPTPVTDGSNVYVLFHELGLVSYDSSGRERWRHPLGPFRIFYGVSASPVVAGDRVLLVCDQSVGSFVLALDKDTGKPLWRTDRPSRRESYTTPVLYPTVGTARGASSCTARASLTPDDVATGGLAWTLPGVSSVPVSSPLVADGRLFVAGTDQQEEPLPSFAEIATKHDANNDSCLAPGEAGVVDEGPLRLPRRGRERLRDGRRVEGAQRGDDRRGVGRLRDRAGARAGPAEGPVELPQERALHPLAARLRERLLHGKDGIVTSLDPRTGAVHKRERLGGEKMKVYASPVRETGRCTSPASRARWRS